MLQYLLNATAIWLISLASYDVFLRRESYHSYNRFYLLFTFLLGALLPVWQWQGDDLYTPGLQRSLRQVITAKENIVNATTPAATWNWEQWLTAAYIAGAVTATVLLLLDIMKLAAFYRNGKKSQQGGWTVIGTGKEHAPFSFMNTLFVSATDAYNKEEWDMILIHEKRHTVLRHIADLVLMQLARIVFWFHPLVYVYNKRLLLVHEYQADHASARQPQVYGRFLIEQALLQTAPSISHSFNRSPIKNRIVMLTRTSSAAAKSKMLVFLPLALVCILCFSKNGFSQKMEKNGNIVTYRGNTFELSKHQKDTISITDPVTGKEQIQVMEKNAMPIKMNGKAIIESIDKPAYFTGSKDDLQTFLLKHMKSELSKLDDGNYTLWLSDIVIDEHGKAVYFDYDGLHGNKINPETGTKHDTTVSLGAGAPPELIGQTYVFHKSGSPIEVSKNVQQDVFQKICSILNEGNLFLPATQNGSNVLSVDNSLMSESTFIVKGHKLYKRKNSKDVALE